MSLQAYLDNIKAQTGKTPEDFRILAEEKGLLRAGVKTGEIVQWLKQDFGLGHGHAMAIVLMLQNATQPKPSKNDQVAQHFRGNRAGWQRPYNELLAKVNKFGPEVSVSPTNTYISLLRGGKKFGIVQITADRMDIGIKLKGAKPNGRFEKAGDWNSMVTHRVQISDPKQIDEELLDWLHNAYNSVQVGSKAMVH